MPLRAEVLKLAKRDPVLGKRLRAMLRKALELPSFDVWAKTITFMAKADKIEWLSKMDVKSSGNQVVVNVPFRYKRPGARWKDASLMIVIKNTPGVFGNMDREGPSVKTMIAGL